MMIFWQKTSAKVSSLPAFFQWPMYVLLEQSIIVNSMVESDTVTCSGLLHWLGIQEN